MQTGTSVPPTLPPITTALVIEDGEDVRRWLCKLLEQAFPGIVITEASTLCEARKGIEADEFALALIDINLPDGSGLDLLRELQQRRQKTLCVMATILDDDDNILHALQWGADGYLLKDQAEEKLVACLKGILVGEPPLSPPVARRILSHFRTQPPIETAEDAGLSQRESEVLTLIAKGLRRHDIAETLSIKESTVASHIAAVYRKLNVSTRSEATVEAIRLGLINT